MIRTFLDIPLGENHSLPPGRSIRVEVPNLRVFNPASAITTHANPGNEREGVVDVNVCGCLKNSMF
jgi:hypothetical protein